MSERIGDASADNLVRLHVDRTSSTDPVLKMSLHRGHAIAVTSNEAVDDFGQTVNIAARIQAMAGSWADLPQARTSTRQPAYPTSSRGPQWGAKPKS